MRIREQMDSVVRLGRLRSLPGCRELVRENRLLASDLVQPIFVAEREVDAGPIESMPGIRRHALAHVQEVANSIVSSGVRAVLVFGVPAAKEPYGEGAWSDDGAVQRAVRRIKEVAGDLVVITDVCLCQYTTDGHCGILDEGSFDLEATLDALARIALSHARAGTDLVAPSAMQDGMVAAIRAALDSEGFEQTGILSYAVKQASSLYAPFRDAAASAPGFGDRKGHQLDPANRREAIAEADQDVVEGADALMVKPGGTNLDLVRDVREAARGRPVAVYQVSGEYSMIAAAAERGWLDERAAALESLLAMKRAGADMIVTYWASQAARWLAEGEGR